MTLRLARAVSLACVSALVLSACASPRGSRLTDREREAVRNFASIGDPGAVAARDIAFARAARDEGQWTAFREYAAPDAVIHGAEGPVSAAAFLDNRADPAEAVLWAPREVWSSCDGTLAVSSGRFREPGGMVGDYATVWQLQGNGAYSWTYRLAGRDDPQPLPPPQQPDYDPDDEDTILVQAISMIDGRVADCSTEGADAAPSPTPVAAGVRTGSGESRDGTLRWRWIHSQKAERRVQVTYLRDGRWQGALDFTAPVPEE